MRMSDKFLGDYQLIKAIGQGSLGTVYLGEHRFTKRQYAIKLLPTELSEDRAFIKRFEDEVALLSTIQHPNIVKIHDISHDKGQYFLVYDCIVDDLGETTNLYQFLAGKRNSLEESFVLDLLKQIASALDAIHSLKGPQGRSIHFGLKPNNILMAKEGKNWKIFLSDFGLTQILGIGKVLSRTLMMVAESFEMGPGFSPLKFGEDLYTGQEPEVAKLSSLQLSFLQSFSFLAPEQKRVLEIPFTPKIDSYSFGLVAYFLLTGELPEGLLTVPSKVRPSLKLNWDSLIESCLKPRPDDRPDLLVDALKKVSVQPNAVVEEVITSAIESPQEMKKMLPPQYDSRPSGEPIHQTATVESPKQAPDPSAGFRGSATVKQYTPERREVRDIVPIRTEMVVIPGGKYWRGSSDGNRDERPRHQVVLDPFAIDIHPVTNEQFLRFLEATGGEKDANNHDIIRLRASRIQRKAGKLAIESGYLKHPVVGVTWYGATAYAKWVGQRLPSEAEWEIFAKGGEENARYAFEGEIDKKKANFFNTDTTAVQSYPPNGYGIYDIAGNVYEWCQDWYAYNYYETSAQEPVNPKGPMQGIYRVLRGACWKSVPDDLEVTRRHKNKPGPESADGTFGFRCAVDAQDDG